MITIPRTRSVGHLLLPGLLWALGAAAAVGCGSIPALEVPSCLKVSEPPESSGIEVSPPSRISLLFSVETCDGKPVSGLDVTAFDVYEDGKPVSAFESQRSILPKGQRYQMNSLVLLDLSGSMLRSGDFPALREAVARYLRSVLRRPGDGHRVALMTFDGRERPQSVVDFTDDLAALEAGLASLETSECTTSSDCAGYPERRACAGWRCVDDSTNLHGAFVSAVDALEHQVARGAETTLSDGSLVVFTDGTDQAARVPERAAVERARSAKSAVFTVGLGGEIDAPTLGALGVDGFFPASQASQLTEAFEAIARRVTARANRFYLLEYCSPKRSGRHTLRLTATLDTGAAVPLVGDLVRTFDASGFTSGCTVGEASTAR